MSADGPFKDKRSGYRFSLNGRTNSVVYKTGKEAAGAYIRALGPGKYGPLLEGKTFEQCVAILNIKIPT